jgi:beta-barrel assembly-enhancing protease
MVLAMQMRRLTYTGVAVLTAISIAIGQPMAAEAININLRELIPRILPGVVQTVQMATLSDAQETALGQQINTQLTQKEFRLLNDRDLNNYVNQIGQRLAAQTKRTNLTYVFQVVDDNSINAAATMGGYVYVNRGLIRAAANEAELASVIAHELGHIEGRHSIEQAKNSALARTGASAFKLDQNTLVSLGMQFGLDMPRSRRFELDADERGLRILATAGYAPQAAADFMKKLDKGGAATPRWLSSHPQTQERVTKLQALRSKNNFTGQDGLDVVAYARRVGNPVPNVPIATVPNPVVQPVVPNPVVPNPPVKPVVVNPVPNSRDVILPTE